MDSNWPILKLEDIVERACVGFVGSCNKYYTTPEMGVPMIRTTNLTGTNISYENVKYISKEFHKKNIKSQLKKGDILIARHGDSGLPAVYETDEEANCLNVVIVKPKGNIDYIDSYFLLYALKSPFVLHQIKSAVGGSVQGVVNTKVIARLDIPFPDRSVRKKIVNQLHSIDKKISLNRQINQTLETIAQAIFKSWFVDFDPVKAKIAALKSGEDAEGATCAAMRAISGKTDDGLDKLQAGQPEDYAKLKATAELFPAAMQDSELGEVPEGWTPSSIGVEFNATMGQSPPGNTYNENGEGKPFFQGRRDFGWRYPENRVYCTKPKRMAKKGDTLLSVRAPVGDINKAVSDCCIGRGIAALRHKSGCEAYTYYSMMDLSRNFKSFDSEGTVFGSINQKDLKALKILKPPNSLVEIFTHTVGTLDQQILNFDYQIRVLSKLRDILLPKLMSGKIRVTNIR